MKKRQVIVVGAGVGGATAAFHMMQQGIDVLLLEKDQFPRDKTCGDGVIISIYPLLKAMGCFEEVMKYGSPVEGYLMYAPESKADDYCFFGKESNKIGTAKIDTSEPFMLSIPRYRFDDIVNKAAVKTGIDYIENFNVTEVIMDRGQAKGVRGIYNGKIVEIESDLVVLANGSHSMAARKLGFFEEDPDYVFYGLRGYFENCGDFEAAEFYYPEHFFPTGYIWFFPEQNGICNVGVFITESSLKKTGKTTEELLWEWRDTTEMGMKRLGNAKLMGELKGWRLPTGMRKPIHAGGVMAVGDAGNMIEQNGGGGIPQAMLAGVISAQIARKAIDAGDYSEKFLQAYTDSVNAELKASFEEMQFIRDNVNGTPDQLRACLKYVRETGEYSGLC